MARKLIVQLHFLHLTTHAAGSPEEMPIMTISIGERKENITKLKRCGRSDRVGTDRSLVRVVNLAPGQATHLELVLTFNGLRHIFSANRRMEDAKS